MNFGQIMGLVVFTVAALIMVSIGAVQVKKTNAPVGFYNLLCPPKKEEIKDIILWNKKHGRIWLIYGVCIELGFWLGILAKNDILEVVLMMAGVVLPLPFMDMRHKRLEKEYRKTDG